MKRKYNIYKFIFTIICFSPLHLFSQVDILNELKEVVITGINESPIYKNSLNIETMKLKKIEQQNPFNLSDALAKNPGISQMTTGNSISKPVIRGLYGNRILVLLSGLRFDNQQWQDEHGLGLPFIGIDKVEIIKGPASVLYGTDALGGVINIIEEQPDISHKKVIDINTRFYTNSGGTLTDVGIKNYNKEKQRWSRLRLGIESHADYSDGKVNRVLNSRSDGYYLKAAYGYKKKKRIQENIYNFSLNHYGFIMEDLYNFITPDKRWSRSMANPHHTVMLNIFNSKNTFFLKKSLLKVNAGFQSNLRMEDEGRGQISLNMHLISILGTAKWEKNISAKTTIATNTQLTFENNTNYGGRIIIPDANMGEVSLSGYIRHSLKKAIIEMGLGGNYKRIKTLYTRSLNTPTKDYQIYPFLMQRPSVNGIIGTSFFPTKKINLKANISSGFRSPNLAELASNGLHEGVYRYELGDPNMKIEQNFNGDLSFEFHNKTLFFSLSAYYNQFFNYIYLNPTIEYWQGAYLVYKYQQQNAKLYGGEAIVKYTPTFIKNISVNGSFATVTGIKADGGYLPFIPANKMKWGIRYEKNLKGKKIYIEPDAEFYASQIHPAIFEKATSGYILYNIAAGIETTYKGKPLHIYLTGRNLANTAYYDHLSRLKYYGLYNPGVNFMVTCKLYLYRD